MLVDIVSKNGNLLINIVQTPEGDLEPDMPKTLDEIGRWTAANGEGIYGSRPWKIFGERPQSVNEVKGGNFNEDRIKYTAEDIRFTSNGKKLYAFLLNKPTGDIRIKSLGKSSGINTQKILSVKLLGSKEKIQWQQEADALVIKKPVALPDWQVSGFRIDLGD